MLTDVFQSKAEDELLLEVKEEVKEQEKEREWREGFEAMGNDPDVNDAEYLLPTGQEVVLGR